MAKPIEWGLILEGQDAVDFEEYLKNPLPTFTADGFALMKEVIREQKKEQFDASEIFF